MDTDALAFHFSVRGAGGFGSGNRNAYQHPSAISVTGDSNDKLVLTLDVPARAGDTVKVSYKLLPNQVGLKDTSGKKAPAFVDLVATNNTGGTARPLPVYARVKGSELRLVFDQNMSPVDTPGTAFRVEAADPNDDRRTILGTGTAHTIDTETYIELAEPVRTDELASVSYEIPSENPLQSGTGTNVLAFEGFKIERVLDGIPPAFVDGGAVQTHFAPDPVKSNVVLYFDEPLDTTSVPANTDFAIRSASGLDTVSAVAVEGDAVTVTVDTAITGGTSVSVAYFPGTNRIRDLAGNIAEGIQHALTAATATTTPTLQMSGNDQPAVDGARLTLTYDVRLNPAKVPDPDRFTLHYPLPSGQTDRIEYPYGVAEVAVRGKKVVLQLANPVQPCDTAPTVHYEQTTGGPNVQAMDGIRAGTISHAAVDNKWKSTCTRTREVSGFSGQGNEGKGVTLNFQHALDTARALSVTAFSLAGASGAAAPAVAGAAYTADAAGVALTLDRALAAGETVEARYERPTGETGLWDAEGNQIADFSGVAVTNEGPAAPAVTGVEVVSDAGEDDTYALGDAIRIRVTFSKAVDISGAPRLKIDMDPADWGRKWAVYENGSGTDRLTFAYELVQPNESTQGIAVLANTLELNGGTIRAAATRADAHLSPRGARPRPGPRGAATTRPTR